MSPKWFYVTSQGAAAAAPPAGFDPQLVCIDNDTGSEFLGKLTNSDIGIANAWTIAGWIKPNATPEAFSMFFQARQESGDHNLIRIQSVVTSGFKAILSDSSATYFKLYEYSSFYTVGSWMFIVITWNGTTLQVYKNGSPVSPTFLTIDNSGSMASTNRKLVLGADTAEQQNFSLDANLHSYGIWDAVLDAAAVTELYNSGAGEQVDWGADGTNYTSSADLLHWWRLGYDSADIGKDYGFHTTLIDVMTSAVGITSDDIVSDYPGI